MAEKTLPVTVYFDVGLRQIKERFSIDKNGLKLGTYELFYRDGSLCVKCEYKNGLLNGQYTSYKKDGSVVENCYYKDDKRVVLKYQIEKNNDYQKERE